jgi:hypothetical protein
MERTASGLEQGGANGGISTDGKILRRERKETASTAPPVGCGNCWGGFLQSIFKLSLLIK